MRLILVIITVVLFSGCSSSDEVYRAKSPNGALDLVLLETNQGATTSFGYEIYIVPTGTSTRWAKRTSFLYGAIRNESAYGVNLSWITNHSISIEYLSAELVEIESPIVNIDGQDVHILPDEGINDPTAPSGGMLYNLRISSEK